jgi:hypothetical protein
LASQSSSSSQAVGKSSQEKSSQRSVSTHWIQVKRTK